MRANEAYCKATGQPDEDIVLILPTPFSQGDTEIKSTRSSIYIIYSTGNSPTTSSQKSPDVRTQLKLPEADFVQCFKL